ncbi:MAG: hypothetical protein K8U57_22125 [Planctomycetes bacterium]|nr:hypothetical protein [Planctomycetota bacterium]
MRVALDFDGTITEHPEFFRVLSVALRASGSEVIVLTYRHPALRPVMVEQLAAWGIEYNRFQFARNQEDKAFWCETLSVDVFFEDTDACLMPVTSRTLVMKVRNAKNFDFTNRQWMATASSVKSDT